jgi:hypothetical protein
MSFMIFSRPEKRMPIKPDTIRGPVRHNRSFLTVILARVYTFGANLYSRLLAAGEGNEAPSSERQVSARLVLRRGRGSAPSC